MSLRLDAPHKRAFALILAVGSGLLAIGIYKLYTESFPHRFFENWLGAISHKRYSYRAFWTAAWGTYLVVVGLLGSFLYDSTVGRLVGWVRNGREQPGKF